MNLSMVPPCLSAIGEVLVEHQRELLRLQALGGHGEILDVGKEHRELLALGVNGDVFLAAEDALVDLRREIPGYFHGQTGEKLVGRFEFPVHAADCRRLAPLQRDERESDHRDEDEIGQQVFEREYVAGNCLADGDLLDAAHVAHLPVALRTFRMRVVASDAGGSHDHRRDQPHAVAEEGG